MPTGYTAAVVDGTITDLRTFALQCARGMGALVMMRDSPWDAPIPERFEPSDYHAKKLDEARAELQAIYNLTNAQAEDAAKAEFEEDVATMKSWFANKAVQRERYLQMIAKVEAWERAPEGLKEFMLEQLRSGLDFDSPQNPKYWKAPVRQTGDGWRVAKIDKLQESIAYHTTELAKEVARTEGRNAWVAQLRLSLDLHEAEAAA